MRSCGTFGNMRRKNGSLANGLLTRTRCLACTLTTAGVTRCSIGASDGMAWPSTAAGRAATVGSAAGIAGAACAGGSRASCSAVAAKPPNAAAAVRASKVVLVEEGARIFFSYPGCWVAKA